MTPLKISSAQDLDSYIKIHEAEKANNVGWWNETRLVVVVNGDESYLEARKLSFFEKVFALVNWGAASKSEILDFTAKKIDNTDMAFKTKIHEILHINLETPEKTSAATQKDYTTALFEAVKAGNLGEVKNSIQMGTDVNVQDEITGNNLLMQAVVYNQVEIFKYLREQSVDLKMRNADGKSVFDLAKESPHPQFGKLLGISNK